MEIKPLTKREKTAISIGNIARNTANSFAGGLYRLMETKEHRLLREATETISHYVSWYLKQSYDCMEPIDPQKELEKDVKLQKALVVKGISEEDWLSSSNVFLKVAPILNLKEDKDYENTPSINEAIFNGRFSNRLRQSLAYFNIPKEEWIRFGVKVLTLYDIYEEDAQRGITVLNGEKV